MRICLDGQGLAGRLTGGGKALAFLLRQLREDFPRHEYAVLSPGEQVEWFDWRTTARLALEVDEAVAS